MSLEINRFRPRSPEPPQPEPYPLTHQQAQAHKARDRARLKYERVMDTNDGDVIWDHLQTYLASIAELCRVDPTYYECRR